MSSMWQTPSSDILLSSRDIHIWQAALDSPKITSAGFHQILSLDERIRADKYHFAQDRNRFIARRGILRTILGHYLSVEPCKLQFCYEINGKPKLEDTNGKSNINFNLSHSQGIALYAFTRDYRIGLDIERIRHISEMDQIAESFFSERENAVFHALPKNKKKEAFFSCWTCKEAFVKATGDGLFWPLDKFDVSLKPGEPVQVFSIEGDSKVASRWSIQELKPASGFAAAFAIEGRNWRLSCWDWSIEVAHRRKSTEKKEKDGFHV